MTDKAYVTKLPDCDFCTDTLTGKTAVPTVVITRDGVPVEFLATYNLAFGRLLSLQGNSVDHATRFEGWSIDPDADRYDFRMARGPWANGCTYHYRAHRATETLGIGHGQKLVQGTAPIDENRADLKAAILALDIGAVEDIVGDGDILDYI